MLGRKIGISPTQKIEPEERITDRAGNPYDIARLGAAAPDFLSRRDLADRYQGKDGRTADGDRVAAQQVDAVTTLILGKTLGEAGEPFRPQLGRKRCRKEIMKRPRSHRCKVRQIDAKQLARDQVRRVLRQIMNSGNDRVCGYDQTPARPAVDKRRIVDQPEPARPRQWCEETPDPL